MLSSHHTVPSHKLLKHFQFSMQCAALLFRLYVFDVFAHTFRCSFNCRVRYFIAFASNSIPANSLFIFLPVCAHFPSEQFTGEIK